MQNAINGYGVISGCTVTRASASSLTIAAGTYMSGTPGTVAYAGATLTGVGAAATGEHRYDIVYLDTSDGTVKLAAGSPDTPTSGSNFLENVVPQPGDLPAETAIMLAIICVDDSGIVSGDFGNYATAGVANMICELPFGAHLVSYLYAATEAQGNLITRGAASWGVLAPGTVGKYLRAAGAGADLVWDNLNVTSFEVASEAQGDLITKRAAAWDRLAAGSANYYLMSQGAGADLVYSRLLVGSLYHASEAQGNLITRGAASWGVLAPGTAGKVLYSAGAGQDLAWGYETIQLRFGAGDGSAVVSTGIQPGSYVKAQANYTIISWELTEASATPISTTTVCDIVKKTSFPPATTNSICASAKPSLSAATEANSSTLTGWTTTIDSGDWLAIDVESNNNGKCLNLDLVVVRR